jgi:hypothetical protein
MRYRRMSGSVTDLCLTRTQMKDASSPADTIVDEECPIRNTIAETINAGDL